MPRKKAASRRSTRKPRDAGHVTLDDIAQACGLSRMSVSYALRGNRRFVSEANIAKVRAAAQRLGYDPATAHAARSLRYRKVDATVASYVAAMFFPVHKLNTQYYALLFQGVQEAFLADGFGVLSCSFDPERGAVEEQLPPIFRRGDVDGAVIFTPNYPQSDLAAGLRAMPGFDHRPIISLLEPTPDSSLVQFDDEQIGRLQADHLLDLGHRQLLYFKNAAVHSYIVERRLQGVRQAIEARRLDPAKHLHLAPWVWHDPRGLETATRAVLKQFPKVTGVLTPNDGAGVPLARMLRQLGKRIPDDLSVLGVDDCQPLLDPAEQNIWTTVRVPLEALGRTAARVLIDQVLHHGAARSTTTLPTELVIRKTTAPPRKGR